MSLASSIYGVGLQVNVPIAALAGLPAPPQVDLQWTLGSMPAGYDDISPERWRGFGLALGQPDEETHVRATCLAEPGYFRLQYEDGTVVVIDAAGGRVWATWPEPATIEDTATYLLGPVMGFVLRLRGTACLHASAVAIDGRALVVAGHAGSGKSSTAAAFAKRGIPVLTDDVMAISAQAGGLLAHPAYPRVRLWPDAVAAMFGSDEALPRITPTWDKRFLGLGKNGYRFQAQPLPLGAICILGERIDSGTAQIQPLDPREALIALVAHSYSTRLLDKPMRAREFDLFARIVERVPVALVRPPADIARISQLCEALAAHAREHVPL